MEKCDPDPKLVPAVIAELVRMGFRDSDFRRLHHMHRSMHGFIKYCQTIRRFDEDDNNHLVLQRLLMVRNAYTAGSPYAGFSELANEASRTIPFISKGLREKRS